MNYRSCQLLLCIAIFTWCLQRTVNSSFKFTNAKCQDHSLNFSRFETCKLTVVGRGQVSLNIFVRLYQSPVTNVTLSLGFFKRASGYKPFLYENITHDGCAFFANRKRYPIMRAMFSTFTNHSNLNHSCPYSDAIIVKDLMFEEKTFELFPLPEGDYMFRMKVSAYNDLKATVEIFFTRNYDFVKNG